MNQNCSIEKNVFISKQNYIDIKHIEYICNYCCSKA